MLEDSPNLPGGDITSGEDPRVLPVGKFLRKTKINELPQIINILLGDLSIIGPRPLTPKNLKFTIEMYKKKFLRLDQVFQESDLQYSEMKKRLLHHRIKVPLNATGKIFHHIKVS